MAQYLDIVQSGATPPDKQVVITFDDGYADNYAVVFPLLKQYGMIGTFFIITGRVGIDGYMTWDQIAEMQRAEMEIGAHTVTHPFLAKLPYIQAYLEMRQSKLDLEQHLHTLISTFAYPPITITTAWSRGWLFSCTEGIRLLYHPPPDGIIQGERIKVEGEGETKNHCP